MAEATILYRTDGVGSQVIANQEDVAALAAQVTKSGFFQQLRTEQQLGYVVSSFAWPQLDVPGIVLLVLISCR